MYALIGMIVVIASILGGFLLEKGNLLVLLQPAELLIIGGAALGTLLIANPIHVVKSVARGLISVLKGSAYTTEFYLESLKLLNDLFNFARRDLLKFEQEIEQPESGELFTKYPAFLRDNFAATYVCDSLRMHITGAVTPFDLEILMESDAEVHHKESTKPINALTTVADALPGLGIVAAVLGVVITMGALAGPPEQIGHKVAAALVGTFLGILLCYGFVGPLAANLTKANDDAADYYRVLRVGIVGYLKGMSPILATESARRLIPPHVRPSMKSMEECFKRARVGLNG